MTHSDEITPAFRTEIERRLADICAEEGVRPLLAIESGSRAWGFPSPDSDYDVRFIYVRPIEDYLALSPPRDVVERPIVDEIDLNGWDIRKALGLMLKHNAILSEWIESPISYQPTDPVIAEMAALIDRHFDPRGYALHYANLGRQQVTRWPGSDEPLAVKKYFYALRPALAIRALRLSPDRRPAMRLQDLMAQTGLDAAVRAEIDELVALKATTREAELITPRASLDRLIAEELARAGEIAPRQHNAKFAEETNALFLRLVTDGAPSNG